MSVSWYVWDCLLSERDTCKLLWLKIKDSLCCLYPHQLEGDAWTNFRMGLPGGSRSPEVWMWRLYPNLDPLLVLCFMFLMNWVASATHKGTIFFFWINRHGQRMWTETMNDFLPLSYLYEELKIWLRKISFWLPQ